MEKVYLSIGGNVGDTEVVLREAARTMSAWDEIFRLRLSSLYRTSPVSKVQQADFLNAVVALETTLGPHALMERCWKLERSYGVKEAIHHGPRVLDIDLLFFGDSSFSDEVLTVPHPQWASRLFVLVPLKEFTAVAPGGDKQPITPLVADLLEKNDQRIEKV